jgi:hypothetical protein
MNMTRPVGTQRSVLTVILLSIVTFGIYAIYWQYKSFQEMKDFSGTGIGGLAGVLLAIFLGIVNVFLLPSEVGNLYGAGGEPKPVSGLTGFWVLIPIIGSFIWIAKVQGALNRFWAFQGPASGATPAAAGRVGF